MRSDKLSVNGDSIKQGNSISRGFWDIAAFSFLGVELTLPGLSVASSTGAHAEGL